MNIESLIPFFSDYGIPIMILWGIIGGEEAIFTLVFLSVIGLYPLWWVLVFVTIGEFISDVIIFSLGRIHLLDRFKTGNLYKKADSFIMKISRKSVFLTLLYSKGIYGTRMFTLVYVSSKKTGWLKFLAAESLVIVIWMSVIVTIGWFAGTSIMQLSSAFKEIEYTISFLLIFILLIVMIKRGIQTWLIKKQKQSVSGSILISTR